MATTRTKIGTIEVFDCEMCDPTTKLEGDMSAAKLVGPWILVDAKGMSAEFEWPATGAPVGTVGLEVTNRPCPELSNDGTPYDADNFAVAPDQPTGSAGRALLPIERIAVYARPVYVKTSGGAGAPLRCFVAVMG